MPSGVPGECESLTARATPAGRAAAPLDLGRTDPERLAVDELHCGHCVGRRKLIALISGGGVRKLPDPLGLPMEPHECTRQRRPDLQRVTEDSQMSDLVRAGQHTARLPQAGRHVTVRRTALVQPARLDPRKAARTDDSTPPFASLVPSWLRE